MAAVIQRARASSPLAGTFLLLQTRKKPAEWVLLQAKAQHCALLCCAVQVIRSALQERLGLGVLRAIFDKLLQVGPLVLSHIAT